MNDVSFGLTGTWYYTAYDDILREEALFTRQVYNKINNIYRVGCSLEWLEPVNVHH